MGQIKAMRTTGPRRSRRRATLALVTVPLTVPGLMVLPTVHVAAEPNPVKPAIQAIPLDAGDIAGGHADGGERLSRVAGLLESEKIDTQSFQLTALTWDDVERTDTTVWARTRTDGEWSSWTELEVDDADHAPDADSAESEQARGGTEPLIVPESDGVQVRISSEDAAPLEDLRIDLVDPGESSADSMLASVASGTTESAGASMPEIYTRAQWGADESIREPGDPDYGQVLGTFVHHTAGTNSYTEADVPAIIRSIYAYHVNGRGWRDIGYNFLVDRFGRIWEGRYGGVDRAVIGAHTAGYNSSAFGTSVLGTYTSKAPEDAVLYAYERLIAWKFTLHGVEPDALVVYPEQERLPAISGHRDASATECPGQLLYDKLSAIRLGTTAAMSKDLSSDAVFRVQGPDRVATAIDASQFLFGDAPSGAEAVVLARSDLFPDALAGVPLAAASSGPLLITPPTQLDSRVAAEIQRILPVDMPVYLLGGTGALSQAVEDQVKALGYTTVTRLAGPDRFATALAIASQVEQVVGGPPFVVFVATGRNFPDALAAGAAAGFGGVVVLSNDATLPQPVRDYVAEKQQVDNALVATVGGPAVPSYPEADVAISGADRYQTAALVADVFFVLPGGEAPVVAGLATGANFPDALSGGAVMALLGGPMLLTNPTTLNAHPQAFLAENRVTIDAAFIFGGSGAVSNLVDGQVAAAIAD
jgi:putative cell wall-binding protein